jgi:hypothetical protein
MKHFFNSLFFVACLLMAGCGQPEPVGPPLEEVVAEIQRKCPQMIDSETRLEAVGIKNNTDIIYQYTLVNLLVENVDTVEFRRALWPGILALIKTTPALKPLREQGIRFEYYYQDKNHNFIYTFKITPTDYNP